MAIFIEILIQKINGFDWAPISGEINKLILVYTILSEEKDFKESQNLPELRSRYHQLLY